jgi:tetratricopeptide (TPR) repeat protein
MIACSLVGVGDIRMLALTCRIRSVTPLLSLLFAVVLCFELSADEVATDGWVGEDVVWKEGAVATLDDQKVDIEGIPLVTTVGEESGDLLWLSRAWVRKQDVMTLAQAIEHYSQQIEQEPKVARWYCRRGWALYRNKKTDEAIADFEKALQLEPKHIDSFCGRAWVKQSTGGLASALSDCDIAIAADPQNARARRSHGVILCIQTKYDEGIEELSKAIELDPGYSLDYANRANAWHEKREYSKALADFAEAIRLDPRPAAIYSHRGSTWRRLGEHAKAAEDYSAAIEREPTDAMLYYHRGSELEKLAKYEDSIEDYREAIRLDPKNAFGHIGLAGVLATCPEQKYRDGKVAVEHGTTACELTEYTDSNFLMFLAAAHAEAGDSENAVKWQQKANELSKNPFLKVFGAAILEHYRQGKRPVRPPRPL